MATSARIYNYDAFSFADEPAELEQWQRQAPELGERAPDFELADVNQHRVRFSELRGRPVVLEFGSYTCPIFCGHNQAMDQLSHEFPEVAFLVVYTREAHPGELVCAHQLKEAKRQAVAKLLRDEPITRAVLIDDLDGAVHRAYGGGWDTLFVIDADGRILVRRAWNHPAEVQAVLVALRDGRAITPTESLEMAPPSGRPFGEGLLRGGERALLDFYGSAPPHVTARLESSGSTRVQAVLTAAALAPQ
jgi:peroxiredoxin